MAALSDGLRLVNESGTVAMSQISVQGADGVIPPETMDAIKAVADDLDAQGVEVTRAAGAPRKEQVLSALAQVD